MRVADHVGQVLMQSAAQRDVDHLGPATDAQQRYAAPDRPLDQRELQRVTLAVIGDRLVGGRVWLLPIAFRDDIPSAGDDQPIQPVENSRRDLPVYRLWRQ